MRGKMTIHVTPIPQLVELAAPSFTLGTANAAGSAATAVASDSTLLVFDSVDPLAVAASAVVGTAVTAPRRDHVHPGIVGAGTVVDNAIARFDGTSGDSLQGYSSLSPTISDAGIISLTSGALKFPATVIVSSEANTLFDYESGTFTPQIADANGDGSGEGQVYAYQNGLYEKIGRMVHVTGSVKITNLGTLTTSQGVRLVGLPFTCKDPGSASTQVFTFNVNGSSLAATTAVQGICQRGGAGMDTEALDTTGGTSEFLISELQANGYIKFNGCYTV